MSRKPIDRAGQKIGRLFVEKDSGERSKKGDVLWLCVCDCGNTTKVTYGNLRAGKTSSCGCLARELSAERAKKIFTKPKTACSVKGCDQDTTKGAKGFCGKHYARFKRYGDPSYLTPESVKRERQRDSQIRSRTASKNTYKKLYGVHEHRFVAEQILGRKLKTYEHVHHIDFDKHNNHPSNLAVMHYLDHLKLHSDIRVKGETDVKFERLSTKNDREHI